MSECIWCGKPVTTEPGKAITPRECDPCWELRVRIQADLKLARVIVEVLEVQEELNKENKE